MKRLLYVVPAFFIFSFCGCDKNPDSEPPAQKYQVPDSITLKINNYFSSFSYPGFGVFNTYNLIVSNPIGFSIWPKTSLDMPYPITTTEQDVVQLKINGVKDKIMQELFKNDLYASWHCYELAISVRFKNNNEDKTYFYQLY